MMKKCVLVGYGFCTALFLTLLLLGYFTMAEKLTSSDGSLWCAGVGLAGYFLALVGYGWLVFSDGKS